MSKTTFNRVLDTGNHFFAVFPGPQAHFISKRDLNAADLAELTRRFQEIRPIRRFIGPLVVYAYLVVCILFLAFALQLRYYDAQLDVRAFQVCWNAHAFYLLGSEDYYGSSSKYAEMFLNPYYAMESRVASEKFLWVAAGG